MVENGFKNKFPKTVKNNYVKIIQRKTTKKNIDKNKVFLVFVKFCYISLCMLKQFSPITSTKLFLGKMSLVRPPY